MQFFIIYAVNNDGQKVIDGFEADNKADLYKVLNRNNYIPIKIYDLPEKLSFFSPIFSPRVNTDQVIEILDNLNTVLRAGIPLNQGLKDIEEDATDPQVKKLITRISGDVSAGTRLSVACKPYEKYFTPTIINLMSIGEETGNMERTLLNGANFLRKVQSLKKNTKKALFTPIISLVLIFAAVAAWMTFVVPGMVDFFKDMDTELPPLTVFLIDASAFLTENGLLVLFGLIAAVIVFNVVYVKNKKFRYKVLTFLLKVPIFKHMIKYFNIAFITEYLYLSLSAGMTLYESLIMLKSSVKNDIYQEDIGKIIVGLERGVAFSAMTKKNSLYTNFVTRITEIGETTGSMQEELKTISDIYYEKVDDLSTTIPKVVQPVTLLIGGGAMALIMLGLMGPIYDLIATM